MTRLQEMLAGTPYAGYAYSYPHKTAYRRLDPPVPLREVWDVEDRSALFLYLHVPFCEMRCGFCNLFTTVNAGVEIERSYLATLAAEAQAVREAIGPLRVARMAVGGGTPTYLPPNGLHALFAIAEEFGADSRSVPTGVETSPETATPERLAVLREWGIRRISIGVQSFKETECASAGRPQRLEVVERALAAIRTGGFEWLNIDLMYGIAGQTISTWLCSLRSALAYEPEELYLYPLYVRPLTGLGKRGTEVWDEQRLACYRVGRDLLLAAGYEQHSMRHFSLRRNNGAGETDADPGAEYSCQEDGMIGLGCGARSYTRGLHYSTEYAVGRQGVREILADYVNRDPHTFRHAHFGSRLTLEEERRRYVIKSLLCTAGLSLEAYQARFNTNPMSEIPELEELSEAELTTIQNDTLRLTERGLELSDLVGPFLYSPQVRAAMERFTLR